MIWMLTAGIGALMGCLTLLFFLLLLRYPHPPLSLGSVRWSGWIHQWTSQQMEARSSEYLLRLDLPEQIRSFLLKPNSRDQVEKLLLDLAKGYMTHTLPEKWPMISMLIGDKTQDKVLQALSDQIRSEWESGIKSLCQHHLQEEQIRQHLIRLAKLDQPDHWSQAIWSFVKSKMIRLFIYAALIGSLTAIAGRGFYELFT